MNKTQSERVLPTPPGQVEIDGDHASLIFQRHLPHPPELVWAALTEPDQLKEWFLQEARIDGRPDGSVDMTGGPARMHWTGRILTWDPPRVFEYEWHLDPRPEVPTGEDSIVRWELTPQGDQTLLTLRHTRLTTRTAIGFAPGTHAFIDRLEAWLLRRPLPNWTVRYGEVQAAYPSWNDPR